MTRSDGDLKDFRVTHLQFEPSGSRIHVRYIRSRDELEDVINELHGKGGREAYLNVNHPKKGREQVTISL
jgi:hypothetical protein